MNFRCSKSLLVKNYRNIENALKKNIGKVDYKQYINHVQGGTMGVYDTQIGDAMCLDYATDGNPKFNFLSKNRFRTQNYYEYAQNLNPYISYNPINREFGGFNLVNDILKIDSTVGVPVTSDNDAVLNKFSDEYLNLTDEYLDYKTDSIYAMQYGRDIMGNKIPHQITNGYTYYQFRKANTHPRLSVEPDLSIGFSTKFPFFQLKINDLPSLAEFFDGLKSSWGYIDKLPYDKVDNGTLHNIAIVRANYESILNSYGNLQRSVREGGDIISKMQGPVSVRGEYSNSFNTTLSDKKSYVYAESQIKNVNQVNTTNQNASPAGVNEIFYTSFNTGNPNKINDLISFTNKQFQAGKIDTLIARFGSKANGAVPKDQLDEYSEYNTAVSERGVSHGRNLLKKDGRGNISYEGYNDPYCRVWTNFHQYSKVSDQIRPFNKEDYDKLYDTYGFNYIRTTEEVEDNDNGGLNFSFENGQNRLLEHGVLRKNGYVNITPKYGSENVSVDEQGLKTKQCMFSIENLAWKGCTGSLSEEQKGPLGGRIMWFPPYGLKFNEQTQANWNATQFIGRGEKIQTYIDTDRSGTLSFKLLIDHPSIINWMKKGGQSDEYKQTGQEYDILRFFAGCGFPDKIDPKIKSEKTDINELEKMKNAEEENPKTQKTENNKTELDPNDPANTKDGEPNSGDSASKAIVMVYFPNNYTGNHEETDFDPVVYLLGGLGAGEYISLTKEEKEQYFNDVKSYYFNDLTPKQKEILGRNHETITTEEMEHSSVFSDYAHGYEVNEGEPLITWEDSEKNKNVAAKNFTSGGHDIRGKYALIVPQKNTSNYSVNGGGKNDWWYRVDDCDRVKKEVLSQWKKGSGEDISGHKDLTSFGLNSANGLFYITEYSSDLKEVLSTDEWFGAKYYNMEESDKEDLYSLTELFTVLYELKGKGGTLFNDIKEFLSDNNRLEILKNKFQNEIEKITIEGFASNHGRVESNIILMNDRAKSLSKWIKKYLNVENVEPIERKGKEGIMQTSKDKKDESELLAKLGRCAKITINFKTTDNKEVQDELKGDENEAVIDNKKEDAATKADNKDKMAVASKPKVEDATMRHRSADERYDNEYTFFKQIALTDSFLRHKITEKIKYFDPAYHSISPEGFNARLTFLQQCTRQGPTIGNSDLTDSKTANNLAFGRQPVCVLRIGDFYYTKIIIKNINIDYGDVSWDLNPEGAGVQPMIADVNLSFDFIGGSDIEGPIGRLQNAVSFNYYANTSIYDNRAEKITYKDDNSGDIQKYSGVNLTGK